MKDEINKVKLRYILKEILVYVMAIISIVIIAQVIFNDIALLPQQNSIIIFALSFYFVMYLLLEIQSTNYSINKNINSLLHSFLIAAVATFLIVIAYGFYLYAIDKYSQNTSNNIVNEEFQKGKSSENEIADSAFTKKEINKPVSPSNGMDDNVLLGIIAILLSFTGLLAVVLSYAFHRLIKGEIHKELKIMAHDERLASNAEMQLATSNIFSKLYEVTRKIEKKEKEEKKEEKSNKNCPSIPCKVYNAFKLNGFLDSAIVHDKLATRLIKKISNNNYKGLFLKVLNNRGYHIYLKHKLWEKLTKNLENDDKKKIIKKFKAKDIDIEVSNGEIQIALKAKYMLQESIANEDLCLYEDVTSYHIEAWEKTCKDIEKLEDLPRWKKIKDEICR